jgi:hypothetical protein
MADNPIAALLLHAAKPKDVEGAKDGGDDEGLIAAMEEFSEACGKKDAEAMAEAFRNAFTICDSAPDEADSEK